MIHRDIKPGNVLIMGSHALVTDFGVAKAISASMPSSGFTSAGMAIGTPAYMAPEQIAADPAADHRRDLYALGLLGYELLTGVVPFKEDSPQKTMAAQLTRDPSPVESSRADVPAALSALIRQLLAKIPDDRHPLASDVVTALDDIALSSGQHLAPLRLTRKPSVARTLALGAVSARMAERTTQSTAPVAGPNAVVATASARRDPRADSLSLIAMADSIRIVIQRAVLDSLVQLGARVGPAVEEGGRMPLPAPGIRRSEPRRVVIAMPRSSRTRPEFDGLSSALADSLRRQIDAHPRYVVVPADSVSAALREARTVNGVQEKLGADLIVSIALLPSRDSPVRLVSVRDLAAPEWASHRTVSSPVAATAAATGMSELVSNVLRALQEMERASRQRPPGSPSRTVARPAPTAAIPPVVPVPQP